MAHDDALCAVGESLEELRAALARERQRADCAEARTRESTLAVARLEALEVAVQAGVVAVDLDGVQTYVNPAFARMVGWAPEELLGARAPFVYWPSESSDDIHERFRGTLAGQKPPDGEIVTFRRRDGSRFHSVVRTAPLLTDQGAISGWVATLCDITEEKAHVDELRRLVEAVAASRDGIGITDASDRFLFVNPSFAAMYGYTPEELVGDDWRRLAPPERWDELEALVGEAVRDPQRGQWKGELFGLHRDGRLVPTELHITAVLRDGAVAGQICYARDVTARRLSQSELVTLRKAVQASGEAVFMTDREGVFTYVNPEFTRLYGWTPEEVVHRQTPRILRSGRVPEEGYRVFWETILSGNVMRSEIVNRTRDGREVTIDGSANPIVDDTGQITGFLAIQRDIGESKRLSAQLVQVQKMEAVGRLAGGVAHDFNNILSVILGYGDILLHELRRDDPVRADLSEIHRAAQRAAALTRQLLMFSRREVSKPEVLDPNLVISSVDRLLRRAIGDDRVLLFDPAPDLPYVKVDPGHLEQVLLNLVINARDATGTGGHIMVSTARVAVPADRAPTDALPEGDYAMVAVSDSGSGMTAEVLARAFDPFFTTKPKGQGTGLGLSIVYGIVRQAGGHLEVDSEPGRGTTVRLFLSTTDEVCPPSPGATLTPTFAGRGETVLLVEDEDAVRALTHRILLREGYRVVDARNAGEAILLFEQQGEGIDLLLSDVIMPQLAGPQLAERLRKIRSDLRVLFMSGYADAVDHEHIAHLAARLLLKPVSREDLLLAVRRALDEERATT